MLFQASESRISAWMSSEKDGCLCYDNMIIIFFEQEWIIPWLRRFLNSLKNKLFIFFEDCDLVLDKPTKVFI